MSARDDLVAAMEAYQAFANSTSDKYAVWDKCVASMLTVIRDHGKHLLALLDAEPVAWAYFEDATGKIDGDPDTSLDSLTDYGQREVLPGFTVRPLYARPEASIADKLRAKGFTERESNAQEETIQGLTR